jgi:hypothetical protein
MSVSKKDTFDVPLVNFRFVDEDGESAAYFDTDQKHITLQSISPTVVQRIASVFSFGNKVVNENMKEKKDQSIRYFQLGDWEMNMVTDPSKEPLLELYNRKMGTYFNMFGNQTAWSEKWGLVLKSGNSYLLEGDNSNNLKRISDEDFKNK